MTDEQMREYVAGKTLDGLMDMLITSGRMYELEHEDVRDQIDRMVSFVKAEIANRAAGV